MKIIKNLTLLVVCILLCLALLSGGVIASYTDSIQTSFDKRLDFVHSNELMSDKQKIENILQIYFFAKAENAKTDSNIDFSKMLKKQDKYSDNYEYVLKKMEIEKRLRKELNQNILWDNINVHINDLKIDGDTAKVNAYENYTYILDDYSNGFSVVGIDYDIELQKTNNEWKIVEIISNDEFDASYLNEKIDVEEIINHMVINTSDGADIYIDSYIKEMEYQQRLQNIDELFHDDNDSSRSWAHTDYSRFWAGLYAETFTDNSLSNERTSAYNDNFADYAPKDCQNYASQAVWFGFDGYNFPENIDGKYHPMIPSGNRAWYQTSVKYDTPNTWVWTGVDYFQPYIDNGGYQIEGPYGYTYTGYMAWADVGDIIQLRSSGVWNHSYVVTAVTGTAGSRQNNNIWVSAHTANRLNTRLDEISGIGMNQSNLRNIRIMGHWSQ